MTPSNPSRALDDSDARLVDAAWKQFMHASHGSCFDVDETHATDGAEKHPGPPPDSFTGYRILDTIHRGGQGVVYQAVQESTGRNVAIKVMREGPFSSPSERGRFHREVRILGQLKHPNIVPIYDTGVASGCHFFVMDHINGQALDEHMNRAHRTIKETLALFQCICEAVNAAHLRGIIHRDLKPANIRVDAQGQPHVLDFGLAKVATATEQASLMTMTGQFIGSMPWASPEQCSGRPSEIDLRTDVYSLGVILFQMLTRRFPYPVIGDLREVLDHIQTAEPLRPRSLRREIDDEVETIVLKCLQKDPERRYQSAGELARDIGHYLSGEPIEAKRDSAGYVLRKHLRRHRVPLAIAAAFVLVISISGVVAWTLYASAETARATATKNLWQSYLTQVRSAASSRSVGRRFQTLASAKKAARIRSTLELRDAATACLALSDLREERSLGLSPWAISVGMQRADRYAYTPRPGEVVVRSLETGQELARMAAPPTTMFEGTFSPNGRYFGAKFHEADRDDDIHTWVWDLNRPEPVLKFGPGKGQWWYGKVAFGAPDGTPAWVAITQRPYKIDLYELPSGKSLGTLDTTANTKWMVCNPGGDKLAVCFLDHARVQIYDVASSRLERTLQAGNLLYELDWSPDGKFLAAGSRDTLIYIWEVDTEKLVARLRGHAGEVPGARFDSTGTKLASWSWDGTMRLWDWRTGELLLDPLRERSVLSFDELLVTTFPSSPRSSSHVEVYRFAEAAIPRRIVCDSRFGHAAMSIADGGRLVLTAGENGVRLWDFDSGGQLARISQDRALWSRLLPDNSAVLIAGYGGLELVPLKNMDEDEFVVGQAEHLYHGSGKHTASMTPDGKFVVVCGRDLVLLDLQQRKVAHHFPSFRGMTGPVISPDARWIFVGTWKGEQARIYDARRGAVIRKFPGRHTFGTFSPDGRLLMVCNGPDYLVFETTAWRQRLRLPRAHPYAVPGAWTFSPDSRLLAVLHTREKPRLIELPTGRPLVTLPNLDGKYIRALAFNPSRRSLVGLTPGREMLVWDLALIQTELRKLGLDWEQARE